MRKKNTRGTPRGPTLLERLEGSAGSIVEDLNLSEMAASASALFAGLEDEIEDPFAYRAALLLARSDLVERSDCLHHGFTLCGSPIERAFLAAFLMVAREHAGHVALQTGERYWRSWGNDVTEIRVWPQAQIGDYRVDFLLTHLDKFDGAMVQIVIECDGHEFHERTKAQAARDRRRDRTLQAAGYPVHRFTGSEIYKSPVGCADEALRALCGHARRPGPSGGAA